MYRSQQFAALAGVTVRALHHYDRLGLLKPSRRTGAGYRLYEDRDLERLEQIIALRFLGIPLKRIGTLLASGHPRLCDALRIQRRLLEEKRLVLDRAIQAIGEAEPLLRAGGPGATLALQKIIGAMAMENNNDWMDKYQTEESRARVEAGKQLWSPELQERVSRQWNELLADVEGSLDEDPAGPKARSLAARWKELLAGFTGRDPAVTASVGRMWQDRGNWPIDMDQKAPVIKPEVWSFMSKAIGAGGGLYSNAESEPNRP